jgi:hypothetical protein
LIKYDIRSAPNIIGFIPNNPVYLNQTLYPLLSQEASSNYGGSRSNPTLSPLTGGTPGVDIHITLALERFYLAVERNFGS